MCPLCEPPADYLRAPNVVGELPVWSFSAVLIYTRFIQ